MKPRPCRLMHPTPVPDRCGLCKLFVHDPRYQLLWSDDLRLICQHLVKQTGEYKICTSCQQKVAVPLYACAKFGQCTTTFSLPQVACCLHCSERCPCPDPVPEYTPS